MDEASLAKGMRMKAAFQVMPHGKYEVFSDVVPADDIEALTS